ncbi:MAG: phospholipase/lecithinase/hemolysin [Verrucomicrobiales bacterium]|nr:phospholipase/lecithinase/hemolysin [Verrucomicrobiales bacterium]
MRPPSLPALKVSLWLAAATLPSAVTAAPVLVIGDSLSKEYQITFPGVPIAGVPGIDPDHPSARNWVEILSARRNAQFALGEYRDSVFAAWKDLRLLGHEYNWAVPGARARQIRDLLLGQNLDEITNDSGFTQLTTLAAEWQQTGARITAQLQAGTAAGVVILIGGNDLRSGSTDPAAAVNGTPITYGTIYSGDGTGAGDPQPLMNSLKDSVQAIANFVRAGNATIPLAICAVPHIGATPDVTRQFPTDAARTGRITTALDALNAELKTWTESTAKGVWVDSSYILTRGLISAPLNIGGVTFRSEADPLGPADSAAAHNRYLFAQDGFHPTTALQALVARGVSDALKAAYPAVYGTVEPLGTREILADVCGIPASMGFTEFLASASVPAGSQGALDDPDQDGLPNIMEFALAGLSPSTLDAQSATTFALLPFMDVPVATLTWQPRFQDNVACTITCQASEDLATWTDVPDSLVLTNDDGTRTARFPVDLRQKAFLRLKITASL